MVGWDQQYQLGTCSVGLTITATGHITQIAECNMLIFIHSAAQFSAV